MPAGQTNPKRAIERGRFEEVLALARLPYFEAISGGGGPPGEPTAGGRLVLAEPALGPAIDVHTHLALSYVLPGRVDLHRETPLTEHYLPVRGRPLDLEVYANRNYTPEDVRRLKRDLTIASLTPGGMRATHTIPNLARDMADLGIVCSVILPIDFPFLSQNALTQLAAITGRGDMIGFGSVHPYAVRLARKLDEQVASGARGVKVHPAVQTVRPDNHRAIRLYRLCGARRLPVLWHCGPVGIEPPLGCYLSQVRHYERPIAECPETTFILGHSGALQMERALDLAKRYRNVWLEVSSQSLSSIRRILAEADPSRVLFGTDWPFYPQAIQLAKVLIATEGNGSLRRRVLHENAARLLGLSVPAGPAAAAAAPARSADEIAPAGAGLPHAAHGT